MSEFRERAQQINGLMFCFLAAVLMSWPGMAASESSVGQVQGTVVSQLGTPVDRVNIKVVGTRLGTATNGEGYFELRLDPGTYTLVISRVEFETIRRRLVVEAGSLSTLRIVLAERTLGMAEMVVERQMVIGDPRKLDTIPGSAHYIGKEALSKQDYGDIHRILENVPGVNIQEEDGYGSRPNIGLRGTGSERSSKITVMEDGVLIAPAPYSAPAAYFFPSAGRMEGIEVRKGSSQIKYGPFTTGGALNLVSTKIPSAFGGRFNAKTGEDGERQVHAVVGDAYRNVGWVVESYQSHADGFKTLDGGGTTGFEKSDYTGKIRINSAPDASIYQQLTFKAGWVEETADETYLGLTDADFAQTPYRRYAGSQMDVITSEHRQYALSHYVKPASMLDLTTTLYRNEFARNWYKLDKVRGGSNAVGIAAVLEDPKTYAVEYAIVSGDGGPDGHALEVKANNREYLAQGVQSILGFQHRDGKWSHEVEVGMRYHRDEMDRFQWVDRFAVRDGKMSLVEAGEPGTESNRIQSARALAVFVQYGLKWGAWRATPGLRFENVQLRRRDYGKTDPSRTGRDLRNRKNEVSAWIPGVGLSYRFSSDLSSFVGIHKGFAPPGDKEGTRPEESLNYETGIRFDRDGYRTEAVLFFNDYSNLLGSDLAAAGGTGELVNGGEVNVVGAEMTAATDLSAYLPVHIGLPATLTYTYTNASFRNDFISDFEPWGEVSSGFELPYIPRHRLAASVGLEGERWGLDVRASYVGRMRTQAGRGRYVPAFSTDERFLLDATLEYAFASTSRLYLSARNVTDRVYVAARRPAGVRPGLPRTFAMGIATEF